MLFCLAATSFAAKIDTSFEFSTIETKHFSIHYHQGLEPLARKASVMAEEVHEKLIKEFRWRPAEKTQVVMIDDSDFTNGFAITIPYNMIYLQVVPPSLASTLGEYDDWLKVLLTHEYAHILSSDPARGYSKVMREIFGKPLPWIDPVSGLLFLVTAPPNTFMPRWWHEGMATWAETKHTGQGRGRGSYYDMVFRTAVAENNLPSVDQINGDVPYWPGGNLPYLYGYRLQRYLAETYGMNATGQLTMAHAGRFPYTISSPAKVLSDGKSYRELYGDMLQAVRQEQSQRIETLSDTPFTPLTVVADQGENFAFPRFSPDGSRIAFTRRDPHEHTSVLIADATGKVLAKFRRQYSDGSISWSPDGNSIYFTQAEINRGFNVYQDLYVHDIGRDRTRRLTRGERLSEVQISPDGKLFATVISGRGSQNLGLMEADAPGGALQPKAVTDFREQRVSSPRWSADGRSICYALTDNAGTSSIRVYDVASGTDRTLLSAGSHTLAYPSWSPDGSVVYYISDQTGVFNVFAFDVKEQKSYQVSHLLSGALQPEPSPDGRHMLLAAYSSRGFKVVRMGLDRSGWSAEPGPSLPPVRSLDWSPKKEAAAPRVAPAAPDAAQATQGIQATQAPPQRYNPLRTLYPRFWLPRFTDDGSDQTVLGAYTAGADVLGYHSYFASAAYSPDRHRGYYTLIYQNDSFYPTLSVRAHSEPLLYADLYQNGYDYFELNEGVAVEASVPLNFLESRYSLRAGYQLLEQKALSPVGPFGTFNGIPVFQGRRNNLFAGIGYDSVLKYPYSISAEEGRSISFLYRYFSPDIGSSQNLKEYSATYNEFLRLPSSALKHHVLHLRLSGAFADGDLQFGQQAFQIGGPPSELNPYPLRGYPERSVTGRYVATGTLEYRAPITFPMRGIGTIPAFLEKTHGAVFVDAGKVWDGNVPFQQDDVRIGAGLELRADVTLGYWIKVTPAIGFAHGFNQGGEDQIYFTVYLGL